MKIPCLFNQCTIRQRLILLNLISVAVLITLISIYSFQLMSLENKLITMERVDDLFNNILEIRRYEKNIMLQLSSESVERAAQVVESVSQDLRDLDSRINTTEGRKLFERIKVNLERYRKAFEKWCAGEKCLVTAHQQETSRMVREIGQELVDDAARLVRVKRELISVGFKDVLFWLTFVPALLFMIGSFIFFRQTRNILRRLDALKKATRDLAAGEFEPIPPMEIPDEITDLIVNFNRMVEELEEKQEQLIQSKKMASIGTFSSGIAHEINNPLNNISLSADTLLDELDDLDKDEMRDILEDIMEQTDRASKIVRNLLDFSRTRAAEGMIPLDIAAVLEKTAGLIDNELKINKIKLVKKIPDDLPPVLGDMRKLQQVFLNLIINAEQAMGQKGTITIEASAIDNGFVKVDITDTGPGINQEHLEHIFDPFFTTKEAGKGTGLGLSIVYGIVKKHGGVIEVSSRPGRGATFSVLLPVYKGK